MDRAIMVPLLDREKEQKCKTVAVAETNTESFWNLDIVR